MAINNGKPILQKIILKKNTLTRWISGKQGDKNEDQEEKVVRWKRGYHCACLIALSVASVEGFMVAASHSV